eukprot:364734-Chlamydomonas_euryale.AAC.3
MTPPSPPWAVLGTLPKAMASMTTAGGGGRSGLCSSSSTASWRATTHVWTTWVHAGVDWVRATVDSSAAGSRRVHVSRAVATRRVRPAIDDIVLALLSCRVMLEVDILQRSHARYWPAQRAHQTGAQAATAAERPWGAHGPDTHVHHRAVARVSVEGCMGECSVDDWPRTVLFQCL